ncbi:LysM peptidoglycan-binding domain-containing protein [Haloimpatiens sp. FM7330]|uniref:LysM peptidoglycan-binding domain-containing protein n=1 Tax=Haloimpatiens sp. FM7330 TaxID=3298610 RepID=UPI0036374673
MKSKKLIVLLMSFLLLSTPIVQAKTINYTVKSGDTIWKLAQRFNTSTTSISQLNSLTDANSLYINQNLLIDENTNLNIVNYTVKSGDTLWKLAQKFNTSVSSITHLNNIKDSTPLYIGQNLLIDNRSTNSNIITYTIKSGDTLWKLAQKFNTSTSSIIELNNLKNPSSLYIGQNLLIEDNSSDIKNVETTNYTVQSGDNLWSISEKFNTSMDAIVKSNMLSSNIIMPGQILTIPVNSTEIVKPIGISMYAKRVNDYYGDIYTWENARRIFTVDTVGTLKDTSTGISFNVKYYGGSNHADIVPLTKEDTNKMKQIFPTWSWSYKRPMVLYFTQGGVKYQLAVSLTGMPHSTTNIYDNGVSGHFDMYFYNSTSHVNNTMDSAHQSNVFKASGR